MQQLYAKVKRSSKYFYQNECARKNGEFPFPVAIRTGGDDYKVIGGPGGAYRLADVNLFVVDDRGELRIS